MLLLAMILPLGQAASPATTAPDGAPARLMAGAGDIAMCDSGKDKRTAELLDELPGTVFTLGDNAYDRGTPWEFKHCYGPTCGRHFNRTRPSVGNHEYKTADAAGYFGYFGDRAATPGRGWYAYDRGAWRVYVLNSNCDEIGGCWVGSRQERWLRADLAARPHTCVLAYWHEPRFSSGFHGNTPSVSGLWKTLYAAGADVIMNGHDHDYERFAPQDVQAQPDPARGIREFVVGTGGGPLRDFELIKPNSEVRSASHYGVMRLRLGDGWYGWRFRSVDGAYVDAGEDVCH
jgi:hypothetical protein